MVSAEFIPDREDYTFAQVVAIVHESLRGQLTREHLEQVFSYNVSRQRSFILKLFPLPLKHLGMRFVYNRSALANTATISNMGSIAVDDVYRPYIDMFHIFMALSKGQPMKGTVCSFGDRLVFSFSFGLKDVSIQRGFFRTLSADGLNVEIESNGVHYG